MTDNQTAALIIGGFALSVYSVAHTLKTIQREEKKRAKIESDSDRELAAIHTAKGVIKERINNGKYDGKGIAAVMNDLRFETIIAAQDN